LRDRITARHRRHGARTGCRTFHSYAFGVLRMAALANRAPAPRLLPAPSRTSSSGRCSPTATRRCGRPALRPALRTQAVRESCAIADAGRRARPRPTSLRELGRPGSARLGGGGKFLHEYQASTALRDPGGYDPAE